MNETASHDATVQSAILDAVCEALGVGFLVYDRNDVIIYASRQLLAYFPISKDLLRAGTRLRNFLGAIYDTGMRHGPGSDGAGVSISREDWLAEQIAGHWRERGERLEKLGSDRWVRSVRRRLPSGYGVCVLSDISEQKKREEQWRIDMERVQLIEEILDTLPLPVFVKDRNLAYVAVNRAFCDARGMKAEALLGHHVRDVMSDHDAIGLDAEDRHVMETGETFVRQQKAMRADATETTITARKYRVGKPGRYFLVTSIEGVGHGDDQIDHVTLSPIGQNSVKTYSGATRTSAIEGYTAERFASIRVLLASADTSISDTALDALDRLGLECCAVRSTQELDLFLDIARSADVAIDLVLIDTHMDFECLEITGRYGVATLTLDPFQLSSEIGYHVARYFNAPAAAPDPGEKAVISLLTPSVCANPNTPEILVAEDNAINQIVFSQILEGLGYSYVIVATGQEAIDMCAQSMPRLVLMDVTLPGINGFEAARQIRSMEKAGDSRVPIVGVLTHAFEGDQTACLAAGMTDIVMKPVSPDILEAIFAKYLLKRAASVAI